MRAVIVGLIVFAFASAGFLIGLGLSARLPGHHLSSDARDTVKLGIGLIATITALVLGLVTASAKSSFDDLSVEVKKSAAETLMLDRTLARYGPETKGIREELRNALARRLEMTWPQNSVQPAILDSIEVTRNAERLVDQIRGLSPQNDDQRWLKTRALDLCESLLSARWVVVGGAGTSVPRPFIAVLVFWLTLIFGCFGLFAPRNATVVALLLICALSVGGAMFLILEMDSAFDGLIKVSPEPLRYAYTRLNQ